ncbi:acyl-CoA dehydrogenase [Micromonospora sp. DR5-3]|uniref:acyl-CoA dehydrogenase n=1 Tax=unclassified Micromonospora TaxID=2617518 RepID=UPI00165232ED|nr:MULTISPECIES: acyl-CoA dehydrogenase [unclassified Micromonospora]MCW3817572.1 acyl-CoA dehydrogenase [Micromonospora sp. DR5-3]
MIETSNASASIAESTGPEALERLLGDRGDASNPVGDAALLAADERAELPAAGEELLHRYGFNAEFVPVELGGRFTSAEHLMRTARAVFRRDSALGIGYGVTSLIAAVPVWISGRADQQRAFADLLLSGRRASACYTELPHGADFTRDELTARQNGGRLLLNGRKDLVNNVGRSDALLVFARTGQRAGSRSHSHVLVERTELPPDRVTFGPRYHSAGVRGCQLGGVEFRDCPVRPEAVLGTPGVAEGTGLETVMRAFQVTRSVLPGMMTGVVDTQLRTVARFAFTRRLYGRPLADLPQSRAVLAGVFADLLAADCLATVAARGLHLLTSQTVTLAAAVKYFVPVLLQDAAYDLSVLLGARSYLREGEYAIFQKHLRDLPVVTLAHASSAVCLASIVPYLPVLARRAWQPDTASAPDALFQPGAPLPPLDLSGLSLTAGADDLAGTLRAAAMLPRVADDPWLAGPVAALVAELDMLRDRAAALPPRERTVTAGRPGFGLARRYASVLAGAACVGVWHAAPPGSFLADPAWASLALRRLAARLGRDTVPAQRRATATVDERLCAELTDRLADGRACTLTAERLAG